MGVRGETGTGFDVSLTSSYTVQKFSNVMFFCNVFFVTQTKFLKHMCFQKFCYVAKVRFLLTLVFENFCQQFSFVRKTELLAKVSTKNGTFEDAGQDLEFYGLALTSVRTLTMPLVGNVFFS